MDIAIGIDAEQILVPGQRILEVMVQLRQHFQSTLVLVTHDTAVAQLADRRLALIEGKLISDEKQAEVLLGPIE